MKHQLTALIQREGDGYVSICPELDIASQGDTIEAARANLVEAMEQFFETASDTEIEDRLHEVISAQTDAQNRSAFIETAVWDYPELRQKAVRKQREIDLISADADDLNAEARDTSDFQDDE